MVVVHPNCTPWGRCIRVVDTSNEMWEAVWIQVQNKIQFMVRDTGWTGSMEI
ncbi:hypothetical protein DC3_12570 [Deinococcus cellulosilyticus NBRC 106333 = KACC 11606]|uniref:Uncharacterized protein n=1 Tax=Deinococcus cellulosilyticus (strain DSM 18568 / NBRC 106333 / KACC 11606 / 5516J-15) TaxID=1223518 RepID=A0A511MYG6_DEIC1|nr:hypothetical protein DC3_12570 [Deinococcus cellulosilyticus NBRC 106333 = KACC 11606]